jgi:hypothetical protein
MNVPRRMPLWGPNGSVDSIRVQWLSWLLLVETAYAVVNMFGRTESPYQLLLREVAPLAVWYGLIVVSAVLIAFGFSMSGAALGMFAWLALVLASAFTIRNGTALSYGGPILLGLPAGSNFLILFEVGTGMDADREFRQRQ